MYRIYEMSCKGIGEGGLRKTSRAKRRNFYLDAEDHLDAHPSLPF
jgi:hypothetical protein